MQPRLRISPLLTESFLTPHKRHENCVREITGLGEPYQ